MMITKQCFNQSIYERDKCKGEWYQSFLSDKCKGCQHCPIDLCENCKRSMFNGPHLHCDIWRKDHNPSGKIRYWWVPKSIVSLNKEKTLIQRCDIYQRQGKDEPSYQSIPTGMPVNDGITFHILSGDEYRIYTDGGIPYYAYHCSCGKQAVIKGNHLMTNNESEYLAVIAALNHARVSRHESVLIISDSMLIVQQLKGLWKINERRLEKLASLARAFEPQNIKYQWVRRDENKAGDLLES